MAELLGYFEIILAIICFVLFTIWRTPEGLPREWPVIRMLPSLILDIKTVHENLHQTLAATGGTAVLRGLVFANMDMLVTADPENVHYVLSANFSNFPKGTEFKKMFDFLGDGIFNSDGVLWKDQRRFAQLQLNHDRFHRRLVKTAEEKVATSLVTVLEDVAKHGKTVDLQDVFQRFTFDSTCILVTGFDPGCLSLGLPEVPFSKAMDEAEEAVFMRHVLPETIWKFQRWLGIGEEKKLSEAVKTLNSIVDNYISIKRAQLGKHGGKYEKGDDGVDLLTSYVTEDETIGGLKPDDKFLRDTVLNFMIAGRDTTSSTLTWFLWLVSTHPNVESKIREELQGAATPPTEGGGSGGSWRLFKVEEVEKLVYLHAAILETLRLYPALPIQHKQPVKPDTLPTGHKVDPTMKVLISTYAMGRMKFIWGEDCLEFKPERWITERGTVKHEPSYRFIAFNAGPRTCLGKDVALTQIKAVVSSMIYNYNVRVVEGHPVENNYSILLAMRHGLKVKVSSRWTDMST